LGYYKVNTNAYVKCTGTETVTCEDDSGVSCNANNSTNGQITSEGAICVSGGTSGAMPTGDTPKYYYVKSGAGNIFGTDVDSVVKSTKFEIHIDSEKTAICVNSSSVVTDNGGSCEDGSKAYTCDAGTSCAEVQ